MVAIPTRHASTQCAEKVPGGGGTTAAAGRDAAGWITGRGEDGKRRGEDAAEAARAAFRSLACVTTLVVGGGTDGEGAAAGSIFLMAGSRGSPLSSDEEA